MEGRREDDRGFPTGISSGDQRIYISSTIYCDFLTAVCVTNAIVEFSGIVSCQRLRVVALLATATTTDWIWSSRRRKFKVCGGTEFTEDNLCGKANSWRGWWKEKKMRKENTCINKRVRERKLHDSSLIFPSFKLRETAEGHASSAFLFLFIPFHDRFTPSVDLSII